MFTLAFKVKKKRFSIFKYMCYLNVFQKNIIKFEFENLLFIYMCLINSNIFCFNSWTFLGKISLFGKYLFIGKFLLIQN